MSSITDKVTGRIKKAAGDLTGDADLRRRGAREERKGEAKEELDHAVDRADDAAAGVARRAREIDRLERET
jgi:uncharacterized protein YjbJ (UPF0337 family)